MTERYEQLLAQAHVEFAPHSKAVTARFAELIVRDCILTIQMGVTRDGHNTETYLRSMKHIKDIKQRFGIEE